MNLAQCGRLTHLRPNQAIPYVVIGLDLAILGSFSKIAKSNVGMTLVKRKI